VIIVPATRFDLRMMAIVAFVEDFLATCQKRGTLDSVELKGVVTA